VAGRPSKYSDDDKARVFTLLTANGGIVKRTARDSGIPEGTVREWKKAWQGGLPVKVEAALPAVVDEFVSEATSIRSKALKLLEQKIEDGDAKVGELNAVIGTLTDKIQLLSGAATSRNEAVNTGPSPEEFGAAIAGFLDAAVLAQEKRAAEIIDAEYEEQPVLGLPLGDD
jgi:transposase-like protein